MFSPTQMDVLHAIDADVRRRFTYESDSQKWHLVDYWEPDVTLTKGLDLRADCEDYARKAMLLVMAAGMKARLVVCLDGNHDGHCICEVTDAKEEQAYYFDCGKKYLATRDQLVNYQFIAVSPWNPQPGETRPWEQVTA